MARLIQKTGFISRKSAGGYMKYIATREGVEVLTGKGPATEKQKEMVSKPNNCFAINNKFVLIWNFLWYILHC